MWNYTVVSICITSWIITRFSFSAIFTRAHKISSSSLMDVIASILMFVRGFDVRLKHKASSLRSAQCCIYVEMSHTFFTAQKLYSQWPTAVLFIRLSYNEHKKLYNQESKYSNQQYIFLFLNFSLDILLIGIWNPCCCLRIASVRKQNTPLASTKKVKNCSPANFISTINMYKTHNNSPLHIIKIIVKYSS